MKFSLLYEELKFSDVFTKASPEEVSTRKEKYTEMQIKERLDKAEKTKLTDGSWHVNGDLNLMECGLKTLKDLNVSIVDGYFSCFHNQLTSLEGGPKEVKDNFTCSSNRLTNLIGSPNKVGGTFSCFNNQLTSLEGAPKEVGGDFSCYNNMKMKFTKDEIKKICKVKGEIIV